MKWKPSSLSAVESATHKGMKSIVKRELEHEMYSVVEEPLCPPRSKVSWQSYRPDLLGYRLKDSSEELVLVECETRPSTSRFRRKNYSSVWLQPYLNREGSVRRILAVNQGRLGAVDLRLRSRWEIWILGEEGPITKIPRL